jgi:hypothetical protein
LVAAIEKNSTSELFSETGHFSRESVKRRSKKMLAKSLADCTNVTQVCARGVSLSPAKQRNTPKPKKEKSLKYFVNRRL